MRNIRKVKNKEIFFVSSEPVKSSCAAESDVQTALWQMYSTARAESISAQEMMESVINWGMAASAALVAGMGFLIENSSSMQISSSRIQFIGYFFISFVALIEASEYMTQTGKMLRAGYFARQIEKKIIKMLGIFPADMAWETFLSRKDRRLFPGYYFTGGGTILLLAGAQFAPFLLLSSRQTFEYFFTTMVGASCSWHYLNIFNVSRAIFYLSASFPDERLKYKRAKKC